MPPTRTWRDDLANWPPQDPLVATIGQDRFDAHWRGERLTLQPHEASRFQILMDESSRLRLRLALGLAGEMLQALRNHGVPTQDWPEILAALTDSSNPPEEAP